MLPPMLHLPGSAALSAARLGKRLARVQAGNPGVTALAAEFVHFVDADTLADDARAVLARLLSYGPRQAPRALAGRHLWVVPRLGTISPWSSKATDIARICGLGGQVRRIERGIAWTIAGDVSDDAALRRALHDR